MSSVAQSKLREWREDPVKFVEDLWLNKPGSPLQKIDVWQKDILKRFPHHDRICMKAAKGPGKTATMAWLCWNFLLTRPHAKIACMSVTADNLSDNLWPELAKWQKLAPVLERAFEWQKTRVEMREHRSTWFATAKTWAKTADQTQQADTLAGFHGEYVLCLMDESGGIPDGVMASVEGALAVGKETKVVQSGNPTHLEGPLYRACTSERDLWYVVEITGDPDDPKRSSRIKVDWARQQIQKYGRDNPWVQVNVFGNFPPASINSLLGPDEVSRAMRHKVREDAYVFAQKRMGIDVARFGDDSTVIAKRQGLRLWPLVEMKGARTEEITGRVMLEKTEWNSELEFVDATGGFGAGVEDSARIGGVEMMPIHFAGKANDPRYYNLRSEMWFKMADWVKKGAVLPQDDMLLKELTAPTYTFHNGKMRLEDKDHIKQRLGFSPDRADALALTFAMEELPSALAPDSRIAKPGPASVEHEYDPIWE